MESSDLTQRALRLIRDQELRHPHESRLVAEENRRRLKDWKDPFK
jgi:hypothetical protein